MMAPGIDRSGLGAVSDLATDPFRNGFAELETYQDAFLGRQSEFRSEGYAWPLNALHTWNRVWEYPYVWHHLRRWRDQCTVEQPQVADIGSGVTFFPLTVARLGCAVTCVDIDPVCGPDLQRAAAVLGTGSGSVDFRLVDADRLPLPDQSQDLAYCISVLEHIPDFSRTVEEIHRILKPGGWLILTIDMGMTPGDDITVPRFNALSHQLSDTFDFVLPIASVHPSDLLHSGTGPYPWPDRTLHGLAAAWFRLKQAIKPLLGRPPAPLPTKSQFAVHGYVLRRRA